MVTGLLVLVVHRHDRHLHPCLLGVQENRERWIAKNDTSQEQEWSPSTLDDAVNVTVGSRLVAHKLAEQMRQEHPNLSFQECVSRVFAQHPALYESELAASEHV